VCSNPSHTSYELDGNKLGVGETVETNTVNVLALADRTFNAIVDSAERCARPWVTVARGLL